MMPNQGCAINYIVTPVGDHLIAIQVQLPNIMRHLTQTTFITLVSDKNNA